MKLPFSGLGGPESTGGWVPFLVPWDFGSGLLWDGVWGDRIAVGLGVGAVSERLKYDSVVGRR